jgi:glyoxylase-like metal-dependent hydrolase (beta-lactamase superfamily II)
MKLGWENSVCALLCALAPLLCAQHAETIAAGVRVVRGSVNGVIVDHNGQTLAIYGDPRPSPVHASMVLFTHHRRDVAWAGRSLAAQGAQSIGPAAEEGLFNDAGAFWQRYRTARFHDYANQSSRILAEPIPLTRTVRGGDTVDWQGLTIHVMESPGYTRGAVSYLFEARWQAHCLYRGLDLW